MSDEPVPTIPEWVCALVGRVVLENEAMRRTLNEVSERADPPPDPPPS